MAGIYLHIPFCKQACHYCDFHFSTSLRFKAEMILAMQKEIELQKNYLGSATIESIYFGGGTPSLLSADDLSSLFNSIQKFHSVSSTAEITLEANPDDLTNEKLKELKSLGINRLSIGIQSFRDEDLHYMNRAHNAKHAIECIEQSLTHGFHDLSIDLIYATPGMSIQDWQNNLEQVLRFPINHISAYCLTVEKNTALDHFVKEKKALAPIEEDAEKQFLWMSKTLREKGFKHYEVSNFAKNDAFAQHNTAYWKGKNYLGIGPSAHSYNGITRQFNKAHNKKYILAIQNRETAFEQEFLSRENQFNEYIMIGLRTQWGIQCTEIELRFGKEYVLHFKQAIEKSELKSHLKQQNDRYYLESESYLFADRIASDLFLL